MSERYSIFELDARLRDAGATPEARPANPETRRPGLAQGRPNDALVERLKATRQDGAWHLNMRSATATMIGRGYPDEVIHAMATAYGRVDNPPADPDVQKLIDGGRAKGWGPSAPEGDCSALYDEISAPALMAREIEPLPFLVSDMIPVGTLLMIAGRPKIGKSFMALQLAWAISSGVDFLDRNTRSARVVYLANEDSQRRIQGRIKRMFGDAPAPSNLVLGTNCQPLDEMRFVAFAEKISLERPALVIIDTWQTVRADGPRRAGTAYEADHAALRPYAELARATDTTLLLIHHLRKAQSFDDGDPFEAISGSNAILGTVDGAFILRRDPSGHCTLIGKGRDLPEIELALELTKQLTWRVLQSDECAGSETERQILAYLDTKTAEVPAADIVKAAMLPEASVYQMLKRLADRGVIRRVRRGVYQRLEPAEQL